MLKQVFLSKMFFWIAGALIVQFAIGYWVPIFFPIAQVLLLLLITLTIFDAILLFQRSVRLEVLRTCPKQLGLGDESDIQLEVTNHSSLNLEVELIDELPYQLQIRDQRYNFSLKAKEKYSFSYAVRPTERGAYQFGWVNLLLSSPLNLIQRLYRVDQRLEVATYPSVIQMKRMALRAFNRTSIQQGNRRLRRIGHSYEFDQIKNYVPGDDYRSINWKASGRRGAIMVNQYEDERAQQVYCVIDKSRTMRMPFAGLSLVDYAINTSLAMSNVILRKYDRAGLITFSDKIGATLKADSRPAHLNKILQALYKEEQRPVEANFELLYYGVRRLLNHRSLLLLFTNFGSSYALDRALPMLRRLNRFHLLVVIFFDNTEVRDLIEQPAESLEEIYRQTVARQFLQEKEGMVHRLRQFGIQSVLTRPEYLSVNTLNKYLELKARGLI